MANLFLLFNHSITTPQKEQASRELGVKQIVPLPVTLSALWATMPPEAESLQPYLEPLTDWLDNTSKKGDYVLIQGDFGACYLLVQHCLETERIPIYSTTAREAVEEQLDDGSIQLTHRFRHVRFRHYAAQGEKHHE